MAGLQEAQALLDHLLIITGGLRYQIQRSRHHTDRISFGHHTVQVHLGVGQVLSKHFHSLSFFDLVQLTVDFVLAQTAHTLHQLLLLRVEATDHQRSEEAIHRQKELGHSACLIVSGNATDGILDRIERIRDGALHNRERSIESGAATHIQEIEQGFDGGTLNEHREPYHHQGGRDHDVTSWIVFGLKCERQRERNRTTESTVGHDELIAIAQRLDTPELAQPGERKHQEEAQWKDDG
mmetsp:Transcript_45653/g.114870  ORF Transcript_45653/g.114870 Transcript_45653/m.114870 type:complete len:238 (-) Transcript_45653:1151-1864(-)